MQINIRVIEAHMSPVLTLFDDIHPQRKDKSCWILILETKSLEHGFNNNICLCISTYSFLSAYIFSAFDESKHLKLF